MTNPAHELHDLLSAWGGRGKGSVFTTRGSQNGPTSALWDDMLRSVRLLDQVREGLKAFNLLEPNRKMLDSIAATIFVPDMNWSGNATARSATAEQLGSLATWATVLERREPQFALEKDDLIAAREAIEEAMVVLSSVPGISKPHRAYIDELLSAALAHLSGEIPDLLAARSAFHEALGVLVFQPAVKRTSRGRELLRKLAIVGGIFFFSQVGMPVMNGIAANVGSDLLLEHFSVNQEAEVSIDPDTPEDDS